MVEIVTWVSRWWRWLRNETASVGVAESLSGGGHGWITWVGGDKRQLRSESRTSSIFNSIASVHVSGRWFLRIHCFLVKKKKLLPFFSIAFTLFYWTLAWWTAAMACFWISFNSYKNSIFCQSIRSSSITWLNPNQDLLCLKLWTEILNEWSKESSSIERI